MKNLRFDDLSSNRKNLELFMFSVLESLDGEEVSKSRNMKTQSLIAMGKFALHMIFPHLLFPPKP